MNTKHISHWLILLFVIQGSHTLTAQQSTRYASFLRSEHFKEASLPSPLKAFQNTTTAFNIEHQSILFNYQYSANDSELATKAYYEPKIAHYGKIRKAGIIVTCTGVGVAAVGVGCTWAAFARDAGDHPKYYSSGQDPVWRTGIGLIFGSIPVVITGAIIWATSQSKWKYNRRRMRAKLLMDRQNQGN